MKVYQHDDWTVFPTLGCALRTDPQYPDAMFVCPLYLDGHFFVEEESEVDFYRAFDTDEEKKVWEQVRDTLLALDKFYSVR